MQIHIGADCELSTTLYSKSTDCVALLHFNSNHLLKCKESIVFLQALRYKVLIAEDTILLKELYSLTISLLALKYPLEITTCNFSKSLLHSHDTLLYKTPRHLVSYFFPSCDPILSRKKTILQWSATTHHLAQCPITAYYKTESLKDILVHSHQAKSTSLCSAPNNHR